jgi:hypothetical protein
MMKLTRQEIILLAVVAVALLAGVVVKQYRRVHPEIPPAPASPRAQRP